ncbi:hypothetical protein BJ138DRAFT_1141054 [Hygrophoropsis aurantiaca]|uniref:Uncharacterized protein n=1 Tax=Hygrophoropsis aurantiaca TaxID=72124 RepID=A0ACB8ARM3_9AGAM|nr:hypothetical protein BJ138DRAFT_1141054 [Hygrophoropsis aurantiaca]
MMPTSLKGTLFALSIAAIANAHCNHPIYGSDDEWVFNLYKYPNCEINGTDSIQRFRTSQIPNAGQCWNVTKHFSPIMSASYYSPDFPMQGYSKPGCKGKNLFTSKYHSGRWWQGSWYDWESDHFSDEYQEFHSFRINGFR